MLSVCVKPWSGCAMRQDSDGNRRELIVIGAGGHAKVVIEVARASGWMPIAAFDPDPPTRDILGVPVKGGDEAAEEWVQSGRVRHVVVAIGQNALRWHLGIRLRAIGALMPVLVHPSAIVSPSAVIGTGTLVMAGSIINTSASIGSDVIVNTFAVVEHDCVLEDGCHVASRTALGGGCRVGKRALLGLGACARPQSTIGDDAVVGVGAVVIGSVPSGVTAIGLPAKVRVLGSECG